MARRTTPLTEDGSCWHSQVPRLAKVQRLHDSGLSASPPPSAPASSVAVDPAPSSMLQQTRVRTASSSCSSSRSATTTATPVSAQLLALARVRALASARLSTASASARVPCSNVDVNNNNSSSSTRTESSAREFGGKFAILEPLEASAMYRCLDKESLQEYVCKVRRCSSRHVGRARNASASSQAVGSKEQRLQQQQPFVAWHPLAPILAVAAAAVAVAAAAPAARTHFLSLNARSPLPVTVPVRPALPPLKYSVDPHVVIHAVIEVRAGMPACMPSSRLGNSW